MYVDRSRPIWCVVLGSGTDPISLLIFVVVLVVVVIRFSKY